MDLEFFNPDRHDYFLEPYREFSRAPSEEEREFFKEVLSEIVEDISRVTGMSSDFKMYYSMTDEHKIKDDKPINFYVHGFSFPEWMDGFDRDVLMIRAVNDRESWKECLINMVAHEMAHQEYYRKNKNLPHSNWRNLLFEGHAMNRAEQASEKLDVSWEPQYRLEGNIDIDSETLIKVLDKDRTREADNIFENGEEPCKLAEGYNIAYQIVKDIVERTATGLNQIPELDANLGRKEVEHSIKEIY